MPLSPSRRRFLQLAAASSVGGLELLRTLPRVSAEDAKLDPSRVQMQPEIEPLVRLLEDTPRERVLEEVGARIKSGTSYTELLAALLLAGVRNVQPRPSVGHKFHAVLVVNSAHIASMASSDEHRWLPIFWALDEFKASQARDVEENNWTMSPVKESAVPRPSAARKAFIDAMDRWDGEAADAAAAGLARGVPASEVFELFCRYGARDFRSIGHKAIYVANSWRTLNCIGWQHAEPVLRSLAYALLNHEGDPNPATSDQEADRHWRLNEPLAKGLGEGWRDGEIHNVEVKPLLLMMREARSDVACKDVAESLGQGLSPQTVWDVIFLASGELLARQPGIVALHAMTSTNAIHYAYQTSANDDTRKMLLLQNVAFLTQFREAMKNRGGIKEFQLDELAAGDAAKDQSGEKQREAILSDISRNPDNAAREVLGYLSSGASADELIDAARLMVFFKGDNSHDYKFASAVLEDYRHISPAWRDRYLAASVYKLRGSGGRDNPLVARTREALA